MNYFTKEKPYNTLNEYYKRVYGKKVCKIALNANFTCPNKDGRKGFGGCTYCSKLGSGDFAGNKNEPLEIQYKNIKDIMSKKWPDSLYMPYLQANSNTYASLDKLKQIYEPLLLLDKDIVGISIATRSDCISEEIAKYLGELNKRCKVQIELGLQTSNENTSKRINRCETNEEFIKAVKLLRENDIEIVVHIINGLPGESFEDMINTIKFINELNIQGIKFHSLLVLKDTKLEQEYSENPFNILTLDEYVNITVEQIKFLRDDIIIHRLAADGVLDDLIEPKWTIKKMVVMNEIDKKLRNTNSFQGMNYKNKGC